MPVLVPISTIDRGAVIRTSAARNAYSSGVQALPPPTSSDAICGMSSITFAVQRPPGACRRVGHAGTVERRQSGGERHDVEPLPGQQLCPRPQAAPQLGIGGPNQLRADRLRRVRIEEQRVAAVDEVFADAAGVADHRPSGDHVLDDLAGEAEAVVLVGKAGAQRDVGRVQQRRVVGRIEEAEPAHLLGDAEPLQGRGDATLLVVVAAHHQPRLGVRVQERGEAFEHRLLIVDERVEDARPEQEERIGGEPERRAGLRDRRGRRGLVARHVDRQRHQERRSLEALRQQIDPRRPDAREAGRALVQQPEEQRVQERRGERRAQRAQHPVPRHVAQEAADVVRRRVRLLERRQHVAGCERALRLLEVQVLRILVVDDDVGAGRDPRLQRDARRQRPRRPHVDHVGLEPGDGPARLAGHPALAIERQRDARERRRPAVDHRRLVLERGGHCDLDAEGGQRSHLLLDVGIAREAQAEGVDDEHLHAGPPAGPSISST